MVDKMVDKKENQSIGNVKLVVGGWWIGSW